MFVLPDDLRSLALHESSHTVVAHRLGLTVTRVEVEDLDGYTFIADFDQARFNVRLAVLTAGAAGEREFLGFKMESRPHIGSDAERIAGVLVDIDRRQWSSALAQARQQAARAVRTHRGTILQVAAALLERCVDGTAVLDGDALAALLDADGSGILRRAAV